MRRHPSPLHVLTCIKLVSVSIVMGCMFAKMSAYESSETYGMSLCDAFPKRCKEIEGSNKIVDPVLLPVIHLFDEEQALRNAKTCFDAGADGVWLIAHGSNHAREDNELLASCYLAVRKKYPSAWLGINNLSLTPFDVFEYAQRSCPGVNGIWTDSALTEDGNNAEKVLAAKKKSGFSGLYFGGVAFKYQPLVHPEQDNEQIGEEGVHALESAAQRGRRYMDVVTTSGTKTGGKPSLAKLDAMHRGASPMAVSGVGLDLELYWGRAEVYFAATALSDSFTELDPAKVRQWVSLARKLSAQT